MLIKSFPKDDIFPPQDGKIIAGIHTTFNKKASGHSEIIKAVESLPYVLKILHNDYAHHYIKGSLFDLHIENNGATTEATLMLSDKNNERNEESALPVSFNQLKEIQVTEQEQLPYMYATQLIPCETDEMCSYGALDKERNLSDNLRKYLNSKNKNQNF